MQTLFPPILVSFFKDKQTTLFMLAYGALIKTEESYKDLLKSIVLQVFSFVHLFFCHPHHAIYSLSVKDLIAFTAPEFLASLATAFFMDFTHRVHVKGFDTSSSLKPTLTACSQSNLCRHMNIIHVHLKNGSVDTAKEYIFAHLKWHP